MTMPRQILAGSTYLVTRRCSQRELLLRPSKAVNEIFQYCLATAAERTGVELHAFCVLSNHWHAVLTDPHSNLPLFMAWVNKHIANCVNSRLQRRENLWSSEPYSAVRLETEHDVIDKTVYVLLNPVAAGLVKSAADWPGLISCTFPTNRPIAVKRPRHYFSSKGTTPATSFLTICPLHNTGQARFRGFFHRIRIRVEQGQRRIRARFRNVGRSFLGPRKCSDGRFTPAADKTRGAKRIVPRIAASDPRVRRAALARIKSFLRSYREALLTWKSGDKQVLFPPGTYWLRHHAGVLCLDEPACPIHSKREPQKAVDSPRPIPTKSAPLMET